MIDIKSEPSGAGYLGLLQLASKYCDKFSLILKRPKVGRSARAKRMESRLARFSITEERAVSWPGTGRPKGSAPARMGFYQLGDASKAVLEEIDRLYAWCLPTLPEDLTFYRRDGALFLVSIAHEKEAVIRVAEVSSKEFRATVPGVEYEWQAGERWNPRR